MRNVLVCKINGLMAAYCVIMAFFAGGLLAFGFFGWVTRIAPTDGIHFMASGLFVSLWAIVPILAGLRRMPEAEARRLIDARS